MCDTYGCEYYGEVSCFSSDYLGLTCDLSCQVSVRKTGSGEDRELLSSYQSVQSVDGGYSGLDELCGVVTGCRVHGKSVDIHHLFGDDIGTSVLGSSHTVEYSSQHVC